MLVFWLSPLVISFEIFSSEDVGCYDVQISDGICNEQCMMSISNFDSSIKSLDPVEIFKGSDCLEPCAKTGCTLEMLSSPDCSAACNNFECGWSLGKCGFCASGCFLHMLVNSEKDVECNVSNCKFDNGQYGWCMPGCHKEDLESSVFKKECNNTACLMQNGIGMSHECQPGCDFEVISLPVCMEVCDNPACEYSFGKCLCSPGCDSDQLDTEGCELDDPCNNELCHWKNEKCPPRCSDDCLLIMIDNGICEEACFNKDCNWDGSDCSCAKGCPSIWDGNSWIHREGCLEACLVETCQFNYQNCSDKGILINALLSRMFLPNSMMTSYNKCPCNDSELQSFSIDSPCGRDSPCYNKNCSYCLGYPEHQEITSCLRYNDKGCAIFNETSIYRGNVVDIDLMKSLEAVIETVDELNNLIPGSTHYLLRAGGYIKDFYRIFVDASNNSYTFADALADCIFPYCSIKLTPGDFHFKPIRQGRKYIMNNFDPMNFKVKLFQKELHIEGSGITTVVFFYSGMIFHSFFEKLFIKDVVFSGQYLIKEGCEEEVCMYCPTYLDLGNGYFKTDRDRIVEDESLVTLCDGSTIEAPFVFESVTEISNVHFINFRNNIKSLLKSSANLTSLFSSFNRIACKESCIVIECEKDCAWNMVQILYSHVIDLNPGFEHTDEVRLGGFLKVNKIGNVLLYQVNFYYNVAINAFNFLISPLLQFFNIQGQILINECRFENIYTEYLIIIYSTSVEYEIFSVNKYLTRLELENNRFSIENTQFNNIFARSNLIRVVMSSNRLNINMINCDFYDIIATGNGVISIESDSEVTEEEKEGEFVITLIKNKREKFYYPSKFLKFEDIIFQNVKYAGHMIYVNNFPNIVIMKLSVDSVAKATSDEVYEKIIKNFINSGKYLSSLPKEREIPSGELRSILKLTNIYRLRQETIKFKNITSISNEFSIFSIESSFQIEIIDVTFTEIIAKSDISCLINAKSLNIIQLTSIIINSIQSENGLMTYSNCEFISIEDLHQESTKINFSPSISIESSAQINLHNLKFIDCLFQNTKGGVFSISFHDSSTLIIKSLSLIRFKNFKGKAGFLYMDSQKSSSLINIELFDIIIEESYSYSSFLMITSDVNINHAEINNLFLSKSSTESSPIIYAEHQGSLISFENIRVENIVNASHLYYGKFFEGNVQVMMTNFILKKCEFFYDIIYIEKLNSKSTLGIDVFQVINSSARTIFNLMGVQFFFFHTYINNFSGLAVYAKYSFMTVENITLISVKQGAFNFEDVYLSCNECIFNNTNTTFLTYSNSYFIFSRSIFMNSYTFGPSILNCESSMFSESKFIDCQFENSISLNDNSFNLNRCNVSILNSTLKDLKSYGSVIQLANSYFSFEDNQFFFNGSDILWASKSFLQIHRNLFKGNQDFLEHLGFKFNHSELESNEEKAGKLRKNFNQSQAIYIIESLLNVSRTIFRNTIGKKSSVIYSKSFSTVILENVTIDNFVTLEVISQSIYIEFSFFTANYLKISNSFTYSSGIGLYFLVSGIRITISNSIFREIHSISGAGIYCNSPLDYSQVFIYSSFFENNSALESGGAIYAKASSLVIDNTLIANNTAGKSGGGIFFSSIDCHMCNFSIINDSKVTNNSCPEGEGGGIKWDKKPKVEDSVIESNFAKYGNDYASYPSKLVLIPPSRHLSGSNSSILTLSPGQNFNESIKICMEDSFSKTFSQDSNSLATLEPGVNKSISILGSTEFRCTEGCFTLTNFKVMGLPDSFSSIRIRTTAINEENQKKSGDDQNYSSVLEVPVYLRACVKGESNDSISCTKCPEGKYLLDIEEKCKECPSQADCPGGDLILPKSGYWKVGKYTEIIYPCLLSAACLGYKNASDYSGTCEVGYRGHLCASCQTGYSLSSSGKCSKCPGQGLNFFILVVLLMGIILVCVVLVRSTLSSSFSPKNIQSIYIKIFTNYLQIVYLTTQFNLNWPEIVLNLFSAHKSVATAPDQVFSIDCYLSGKSMDTEAQYYTKMILFTVLPISIILICFIFWYFLSLYKESYKYLKRELFSSIIILFFLIHPNITKFFFSSFSCKELETIGYWLSDNLEVQCYTKKHKSYLSIVSGPNIIIWVLGFPAILLVILIKKRKFLHLDTYKVIFGFLYNGYKSSKFYWEFIILYRKILIICIITFMATTENSIQALTVNFFLVLSIYLQFNHHPFSADSLNKLEMRALVTATLTIYSGLYYLTDNINEAAKIILFVVIVLGNAYFLCFWTWYNLKALIDVLVVFFPIVKNVCKKGDGLGIDFYEENIQQPGIFGGSQAGERVYSFRQNVLRYPVEKMEGVNSMKMLFIAHLKEKINNPSIRSENHNPSEVSFNENSDLEASLSN